MVQRIIKRNYARIVQKGIVNDPTCFKKPDNSSCIDFFLTNRKRLFLYTTTIEKQAFPTSANWWSQF